MTLDSLGSTSLGLMLMRKRITEQLRKRTLSSGEKESKPPHSTAQGRKLQENIGGALSTPRTSPVSYTHLTLPTILRV